MVISGGIKKRTGQTGKAGKAGETGEAASAAESSRSSGSSESSDPKPSGPASPAGRPGLLHWDDLPAWRRDNAYIHHGYRPTSNSYVASLVSVAAVHNESVNIWTHLGGAVAAVLLGAGLASVSTTSWFSPLDSFLAFLLASPLTAPLTSLLIPLTESPPSSSSVLVLSCFAAGAIACLGMSATYHTLTNHSQAVARWGNKLDYTGIIFLIVGSYMPTLYYGLFCHPHWLTVYTYLIILLGLACLTVSWLDHFRTPQWRPYRALLFVGLGASGVVPIFHSLLFMPDGGASSSFIERVYRLDERMGLRWVLLQGGLYILGAAIYAARVPERWRPGHFDIWGSSHQIFHVFVLLAAAAHLRGIVQAYTHHHVVMGAECPAPPL